MGTQRLSEILAEEVSESDDFEVALRELVRTANRNGIRIEGGWEFRYDEEDLPDLEVLITELSKLSTVDSDDPARRS